MLDCWTIAVIRTEQIDPQLLLALDSWICGSGEQGQTAQCFPVNVCLRQLP